MRRKCGAPTPWALEVRMNQLLSTTILSFALAVPVATSSAQTQSQDTSRIITPAIVAITGPTVIGFAADTTQVASSSARAVAESLGFTVIAHRPPLDQVADQRHSAVYYVPRDLKAGYVIIVPGRRPDIVWGLVTPDSLRTRIRGYLTLNRDLAPGSD